MKTLQTISSLTTVFMVTLLLTSAALSAQPNNRGEKKEEIKAMKIAFFTEQMSLTPQEAEKFWPVYNEFTDNLDKLKKERNQSRKAMREGWDTLTDAEVEKSVDQVLVFQQRELDIRKEYHSRFKKVLPIKKVAQLYKAETEFKKTLLRKIREHNGPRPGGAGRPGRR